MSSSVWHARKRTVIAAAILASGIIVPSAGAADAPVIACAASGTVRTTTGPVDAADIDNMSLTVTGSALACAPLGTASFSFSGVGTGACGYGGTGVGNISISSPGGSYSGFAEWTVANQGGLGGVVEIDSIVTDPSARNSRVTLAMTTQDPSIVAGSTSSSAALCTASTQSTVAPAIGTLTANKISSAMVPGGVVKGCDTALPRVGVDASNPTQNVDNLSEGMLQCRKDTQVVDAPVGDGAALASSTTTPMGRSALATARGAGLIQGGPQCVEDEFFRPKNEAPRGFEGEIVVTGQTGNHAAELKYEDTASFTSGLEISASVTVKTNAILAGIEGTFGVAVQVNWTTSNSRGFAIQLPPHSKGWIKYGHTHIYTEGHYFRRYDDCYVEDLGSVTVNGPYKAGFMGS